MRAPLFEERHGPTVDTAGPDATIPPPSHPFAPEDIAMPTSIDRRTFLKGAGTTAAVALVGGPLLAPSRVGAGDRLVVAVGQWGIETPFSLRSRPSGKTLWG